jgi:peptidoglycan/xylan/chitin deacetylase (PgdA/CDA1 family)
MVLKSPGFIRHEIEETDALIRAAGQRGPIYFRAPYCKKLVGLPWYLWRTDRTHVTWDVEPDSDARVAQSAERIAARTIEHARPGSIILLHIWYGHPPARAAVPLIVDGLHAKGYRFVTISELLALERQPPTPLQAAPDAAS